jgi:hypothetical protein
LGGGHFQCVSFHPRNLRVGKGGGR